MKKIILFGLGIIVGILLAIAAYFLTFGEVAWKEYTENKLAPNLVLSLTTIFGLYLSAKPILAKVQNTLLLFDKATKDVNETVDKGKRTECALSAQDEKIENALNTQDVKMENALRVQDEKIASYDKRFDEMERMFLEGISSIKSTGENTEKIVRLGFCNSEELVKKGYAAEIEKVGAKHEQEENQ